MSQHCWHLFNNTACTLVALIERCRPVYRGCRCNWFIVYVVRRHRILWDTQQPMWSASHGLQCVTVDFIHDWSSAMSTAWCHSLVVSLSMLSVLHSPVQRGHRWVTVCAGVDLLLGFHICQRTMTVICVPSVQYSRHCYHDAVLCLIYYVTCLCTEWMVIWWSGSLSWVKCICISSLGVQ